MQFLYSPIVLLFLLTSFTAHSQSHSHWINEIHYVENDLSKGFEICGPAYVDLSNWSYTVYNSDGSIRSSDVLHSHGTIERESPGSFGCIWVDADLSSSGGAIAFLDDATLLDFISYEVPLTVDINFVSQSAYQIPVIEDPASQRMSLQLTGVGTTVDSFRWWQSIFPSYGSTNVNQAFMSECVNAPLGDVWHELLPYPDPDYNCTLYESRMGYCAFSFATMPGIAGLTGQQACCICGGGVTWGPTTSPSYAPSTLPSSGPSTTPSIEPTKSIEAYEEELADCQNQTQIYQDVLDGYTSTIAMCEARGISLSCTSGPTGSPITLAPSALPSDSPEISVPSGSPSETPSNSAPSTKPSPSPQTVAPTDPPIGTPSRGPSVTDPSQTPSETPTQSLPSGTPSMSPSTEQPSGSPSANPTDSPVVSQPTSKPVVNPSTSPALSQPSTGPSEEVFDPTCEPTANPTYDPTSNPSENPSTKPSDSPSCTCRDLRPPSAPNGVWSEDNDINGGIGRFTCEFISFLPDLCDDGVVNYGLTAAQACCSCGGGSCNAPSLAPIFVPTSTPTISEPSLSPVFSPPSTSPSLSPTESSPTVSPSLNPSSEEPTLSPVTSHPSASPTFDSPSQSPSISPSSEEPTVSPETSLPSLSPSFDDPTVTPTTSPEISAPSISPTSDEPSTSPEFSDPTRGPSNSPSTGPSNSPTSSLPSQSPESSQPTVQPTDFPTETKVDCYDYTPVNGTAFYGGQYVDKWYDSQALRYDCDWYARTNRSLESCVYFSPLYIGLDGLNAAQACCSCGGGITDEPSAAPSPEPTVSFPSSAPSQSMPTVSPSGSPSISTPSRMPSAVPSQNPSIAPTPSDPSKAPSDDPTASPTVSTPTTSPSMSPETSAPTETPIHHPTTGPLVSPTVSPSHIPSTTPSRGPSAFPSTDPTAGPTCKCEDLRPPDAPGGEWHEKDGEGRFTCAFYEILPELCLTIGTDSSFAMYGHSASSACCVCGGGFCGLPTISPTNAPSVDPTAVPTVTLPSVSPTVQPSLSLPSLQPSDAPTFDSPSHSPSSDPLTSSPTDLPSIVPTTNPSVSSPTVSPSLSPTVSDPSTSPSLEPSVSSPSTNPSTSPSTSNPSTSPSESPETTKPTCSPSSGPSTSPTDRIHCVDFVPEAEEAWYDGYPTAQKWTCEVYETYSLADGGRRNYCDIFTNPDRDANFGMIANQACCFCGGGITSEPTKAPTSSTAQPSKTPARVPTTTPSAMPSSPPDTDAPSSSPSKARPTKDPTAEPTVDPTFNPTQDPSLKPTSDPSLDPTMNPTSTTLSPTEDPTNSPSMDPTSNPSQGPSLDPSEIPTTNPTYNPTLEPTIDPTDGTNMPSLSPSTSEPTPCECYDLIPPGQEKWYDSILDRFDCDWYATNPEVYCDGGRAWSNFGLNALQACCACVDPVTGVRGGSCYTPSNLPTVSPTVNPSVKPTDVPSVSSPSTFPSRGPTPHPSNDPTMVPTSTPSNNPTLDPTLAPTSDPSLLPSMSTPTIAPSGSPVTTQPSLSPSKSPSTSIPTGSPSGSPSAAPTERTCAEKVEDTVEDIALCQSNLDEAISNLTLCESTTVDQSTYDELLLNISDCEAEVVELQDELHLLQNGELSACEGNVYVQVYRSDFDFFTGVYFMDEVAGETMYTAINNDVEQVLKHLANGTWILTNGDVRLVTPVVLTGIYPPSLDQWVDANGLLVIVKMSCYDPQVVDDCECGVYDSSDVLYEYSGMTCSTAAAQFGGTACDHPLYGSYISHFCPETCGKSWADVLVDDDDDVALYGSTDNIDWPFSQCRDPAAYCVDEYVQHPVYRTLCPIATAECENILDVCDLVCTSRRRRLQDISSTCPYATVTAYHSSYASFDGTYTLTDVDNMMYQSDSATMSYSDGVWSLDDVLTTETNDPNPPAAANWRSDSGSVVVATIECALNIDAMTYEECTEQLSETQQELNDCNSAITQLEQDTLDCWTNCATNQQAGAECEDAKAAAETRDAFVDVETVDSGTDIGWEEAGYVSRGLDADMAARLRYHNNEIVYDNLDGTYTRTCVAYSTSATSSCDHDDLICPGGSTYGWPGQTYVALSKALARPDHVHPDCPTGCQTTEWWSDQLTEQGLNSQEVCVIDDAFYYIEERQYVFTCIATSDDYESLCPNNNVVCAGTNSEGYKIFGWPLYQTQLLSTALEQINHRYPYCPNY